MLSIPARWTRLAIGILCFLVYFGIRFTPASPAADPVQAIVKIVENRYHNARTLKAVFFERYTEGRQAVRGESGTAYFSRPGRMRWEYEEPETKLFLTDGKTAWFYVPADHTVTRAAMKESSDWRTPLALLTGNANLSKFCKHIELVVNAHNEAGLVTLRCDPSGSQHATQSLAAEALTPDQSGDIREILLNVDPKEGWLASVIIRQASGIEMEYRFGKWQENLDLPDSMFHFVAPKGVAIVDGNSSGARNDKPRTNPPH